MIEDHLDKYDGICVTNDARQELDKIDLLIRAIHVLSMPEKQGCFNCVQLKDPFNCQTCKNLSHWKGLKT